MSVGMGGHHSSAPESVTWLTPPYVIDALGGPDSFDLDPCAAPGHRTAKAAFCLPTNGLMQDWFGRVWVNPPYTSAEIGRWLKRLGDHGEGTALIFARTETEAFQRQVWDRASGLLFLEGRLNFHHADGRRAARNAGAPSVLCAYGEEDLERLAGADLRGALVPLRFSRGVMVLGIAHADEPTWREVVRAYVERSGGRVALGDLYRALARHPKTRANRHWQAKVRQTLQQGPFIAEGAGRWAIQGSLL